MDSIIWDSTLKRNKKKYEYSEKETYCILQQYGKSYKYCYMLSMTNILCIFNVQK